MQADMKGWGILVYMNTDFTLWPVCTRWISSHAEEQEQVHSHDPLFWVWEQVDIWEDSVKVVSKKVLPKL